MSHSKKVLYSLFLCFSLLVFSFPVQPASAKASDYISFVILTKYSATVDIGSEFYIAAFTSTGKPASWSSSNSKVAAVNTYGKVTAKKSGTVTITAKIKNAEASCKVHVNKTKISISKTSVSLERNEPLKLSAATSNNSVVVWKSIKKSIATVDENGNVTAIKPGETEIIASADDSTAVCKVTVKLPDIKLNKTSIKLFRGQSAQLTASVSSGIQPVWKTNRKSVAVVDETGLVTAVKHGTALISATVDGVSKICEVVVEQPVITLSSTDLKLKKGNNATLTATVSSGNPPVWSTSNSDVATVDPSGRISAVKKGTAYIYASEDGVKVKCTVHVTE